MTAPLDLARLRALALAATPGPWERSFGRYDVIAPNETNAGPDYYHVCDPSGYDYDRMRANAEYIAAANPAAVQHLLALHDDRCREVLDLSIRLAAVEAELARVLAERDRLASDASWDRNPDRSGA